MAWPLYSTLSKARTFSATVLALDRACDRSGISLLMIARSLAVTTAITPVRASAFDVSMDRIFACAWGLRSILSCSSPAVLKSAPNRARPVTLSNPSDLTGRVPSTLNFLGVSAVLVMLFPIFFTRLFFKFLLIVDKHGDIKLVQYEDITISGFKSFIFFAHLNQFNRFIEFMIFLESIVFPDVFFDS